MESRSIVLRRTLTMLLFSNESSISAFDLKLWCGLLRRTMLVRLMRLALRECFARRPHDRIDGAWLSKEKRPKPESIDPT